MTGTTTTFQNRTNSWRAWAISQVCHKNHLKMRLIIMIMTVGYTALTDGLPFWREYDTVPERKQGTFFMWCAIDWKFQFETIEIWSSPYWVELNWNSIRKFLHEIDDAFITLNLLCEWSNACKPLPDTLVPYSMFNGWHMCALLFYEIAID